MILTTILKMLKGPTCTEGITLSVDMAWSNAWYGVLTALLKKGLQLRRATRASPDENPAAVDLRNWG